MGLLDDAIREHLELKRRRGADPGEVAREQQEALEPVLPVQAVDDAAVEDLQEVAPQEAPHVDHPGEEALPLPGPENDADPEFPAGAQETAELDMESVLHDDHAENSAPVGAVFDEAMTDEPDTQFPAEQSEAAQEISDEHGEVPGREHLSFE